jgi:hypothetical protein
MMQVENGKTLELECHLGTICLVTPIMAFSVAKHIVPIWDNLEKPMGKWQVEHNISSKAWRKTSILQEEE